MSLAILRPKEWPIHIDDFVRVAPLLAGVMAPFSILLDIPALSVCTPYARSMCVLILTMMHGL